MANPCAHCEESPCEEWTCPRCRLEVCESCATKVYTIANAECVQAQVRRHEREGERRDTCDHQFVAAPGYPGRDVQVCTKCDLLRF